MLRRLLVMLAIAVLLGGHFLTSASAAAKAPLPGYLDPVRAGVDQVAPGVLQFWMELEAPPVMDPDPEQWITYIWCVDTDCDARTGQAHESVGSEYNIRAVIRNHVVHGGGFIDGIYRPGGPAPMYVDGNRVIVRVTRAEIGSPESFNWNCGVFASTGGHQYLMDPRTFDLSGVSSADASPARVVVEPDALLQSGVTSVIPQIRAYDGRGNPLSLEGRAVRLFPYRDLVEVASGSVRAATGRAGMTRLTAMVDGIVSCNVMRATVGSVEIVPSAMHLQWPAATVGKAAFRVLDAQGGPLTQRGHRVSFTVDDAKVAGLSADGVVEAQPAGAGKTTYVRGEYDGTLATNHCDIRVLSYPVPLLPDREDRGKHIAFWHPPVAMSPPPTGCRIEQMLEQYDVVRTLDEIFLRMRELTGVVPISGRPQHLKVLCEDDQFTLCGGAGGDVGLGFNPLKPIANSCVQVSGSRTEAPHWGIMSHEIGHCFVGEFAALNRLLGDPRLTSGPAYGEGLATLCNIWARYAIAARADHYGVSAAAVESFEDPKLYDSLPFHRRIYVDERLAPYLVAGGRYPEDCTPDVLDGMLMVLGEKYGWDIFPRFFSVFYPPDEPIDFTPRDERGRATFFIAAMSAAACQDLRPEFGEWGLPCDDGLFRKLLPELAWRAAQREASPALRITAPAPAARLAVGKPVHVSVTVAPDAQVDTLHFQVNGKDCALRGKAPYEFDWNTGKEAPGVYFLRAVAEMKDGTQQKSVPVLVEVAASE